LRKFGLGVAGCMWRRTQTAIYSALPERTASSVNCALCTWGRTTMRAALGAVFSNELKATSYTSGIRLCDCIHPLPDGNSTEIGAIWENLSSALMSVVAHYFGWPALRSVWPSDCQTLPLTAWGRGQGGIERQRCEGLHIMALVKHKGQANSKLEPTRPQRRCLDIGAWRKQASPARLV
jgi:hypothetical protein